MNKIQEPAHHSGIKNQVFNGVTFSIGTEATNAIVVTAQLTYGGADITERASFIAYISDDANGDSVVGTAHDGAVAVSTDGVAEALVAKKVFHCVSESDGDWTLSLTESGAKTAYLVIVDPVWSFACQRCDHPRSVTAHRQWCK